jgi:hypothetical protein
MVSEWLKKSVSPAKEGKKKGDITKGAADEGQVPRTIASILAYEYVGTGMCVCACACMI